MRFKILLVASIFSMMLLIPVANSEAADPPDPDGMFHLYKQNRTEGISNYITEDFIVLSYAMFLNEAITDIEANKTRPLLMKMTDDILGKMPSEKRDEVSLEAMKLLVMIKCLIEEDGRSKIGSLKDQYNLPDEINESIKKELALVNNAEGVQRSFLFGQKIDYSQFIVRGKYTRSPKLAAYFRAVKYASTPLFHLKESKATGVTTGQANLQTGTALMLSKIIMDNEDLAEDYQRINRILSFISGPADDLGAGYYYDFYKSHSTGDIAKTRAQLLKKAKDDNRQPAIVSGFVNIAALEKGVTVRDVVTGWRLLPSRYSVDSAVFQMLVYDNVRNYLGEGKPFTGTVIDGEIVKGFPLSDELMRLLGSETAAEALKKNNEINYRNYRQAYRSAEEEMKNLYGFYGEHLGMIRSWIKDHEGKGSTDLDSIKAFWTYLKYINQLYQKQSYTIVGKGFVSPPPRRNEAYLEPSIGLYKQILDRLKEIEKIYESKRLSEYQKLIAEVIALSEKIASDKKLDSDEIEFLNNIDTKLKGIIGRDDHPIVVDVHTDLNSGKVLEEAVGCPKVCFKQLKKIKARGGRLTHFEFKYDMSRRLTDERWMEILNSKSGLKSLEMYSSSTKK